MELFTSPYKKHTMNVSYLFAAFFWGTIGFGFFIYGKKQKSMIPLVGGILLMGVTYLVRTALNLSLISIAIIGVIYVISKRF